MGGARDAIRMSIVVLACLVAADEAGAADRLRYVSLGDSYTIGQGAKPDEAWPAVLARALNEAGVSVELVANAAHSGYTTAEVLAVEVPELDTAKADFVTLSIGTNDWVGGMDEPTFRRNLVTIVDRVQARLTNRKRLLLTTIPDFAVTPSGPRFAAGRDVGAGLATFNSVIRLEAARRGLDVVDLFTVSKAAANDRSLVSADGLHPSAKGYAAWADAILPQALAVLRASPGP